MRSEYSYRQAETRVSRYVYYALMGGYFPCSVRLSVYDPPANTTHARKGSTLRLTF